MFWNVCCIWGWLLTFKTWPFLSNWKIYPRVTINRLKNGIKKCPHIAYKLNISDMCSQENKICLMKRISFRNISNQNIRCPCPNEHSYECDSHYCASDSDACHAFKSKNISLGTRAQLKPCQKHNRPWK